MLKSKNIIITIEFIFAFKYPIKKKSVSNFLNLLQNTGCDITNIQRGNQTEQAFIKS